MKKLLSLFFLASVAAGCQSASQQTVNTNIAARTNDDSQIVSSHSTDGAAASPSAPANSPSNGGSPMAKAVDVGAMTAEIEKAKKVYGEKPGDEKAKKDVAKAYFVRAFALTEAAQYRAALGDFRKGLKLDPNDQEAKKMHDEILRIFKSINREPPKEGEEPEPMQGEKSAGNQTKSSVEKIEFSKGATSAVAAGKLSNYDDSKNFSISVGNGQMLRTEQVKDKNSLKYITVSVSNPNGEIVGDSDASCNNRKEIKPTVAGEYRIKVTEYMKADEWRGEFKLKVSAE